MKKPTFKILASLTTQELASIYELTYKYGWLVAEERQEGWLPDKAYMAKAKIEGELNPWIDHGLEEMADTYSQWLDFHLPDGWVESMMEGYSGTDDLEMLVHQFDRWTEANTALLTASEIQEKIVEAAWDALGGTEAFAQDDPDYLYELFGSEFIDNYIADIRDVEDAEDLQYEWDAEKNLYSEEEAVASFIVDHDLESLFNEHVAATGYGGLDWFVDNYSIGDISSMFPSLVDNQNFYVNLYSIYLENFPGLEEEIDGINQTYSEIASAEGASLSDKIITFQLGLTTAHHHGIMADHLLGVQEGTGKIILDEISSGPNVASWNKDLEQIIGVKTPSQNNPEYFTPESSLYTAVASIQQVLLVL